MKFAILCYDDEKTVGAWTKEQDEAVMQKLGVVQDELAAAGKLGPVARLAPTSEAKTLRKGASSAVLDGPFAETKEQLLGFFVVECDSFEEAVAAAQALAGSYSSAGAYEIRPMTYLRGA